MTRLFFGSSCALSVLVFILMVFYPPLTHAACSMSKGNVITGSCSFSRTIDGVDAGSGDTNTAALTIQNSVLTITPGQKIASGTFVLGEGGSIALPADGSGAIIPDQPLYIKGGFYDPNYPSNQNLSLTQVDGSYLRASAITSQYCKPYQACPTSCGQPATTRAGNSSGQTVDALGNCLYRTCPATSPCCDAACCGQSNGTECNCTWTGCYNDARYPGLIVARRSCGTCQNQQCTNVQCKEMRGWPVGSACFGPGGSGLPC